VLVVDEASMLDLALTTRLIEALPDHARLVLLGDKDQLSAVEAGAVFADLSGDPRLMPEDPAVVVGRDRQRRGVDPPGHAGTPCALQDAAIWFTDSHRFDADSGIGRLPVMSTSAAAPLRWIRSPSKPAVPSAGSREDADGLSVQARSALIDGYGDDIDLIRASCGPGADAHRSDGGLRRIRSLPRVVRPARGAQGRHGRQRADHAAPARADRPARQRRRRNRVVSRPPRSSCCATIRCSSCTTVTWDSACPRATVAPGSGSSMPTGDPVRWRQPGCRT
jgi:exodeoxyribonuclease V alpha subunit